MAKRPTKGIVSRSETMIADTACERAEEVFRPLGDRRLRNDRLLDPCSPPTTLTLSEAHPRSTSHYFTFRIPHRSSSQADRRIGKSVCDTAVTTPI